MIILGIESSCDETAVAVVKDGREVLSSVVASQVEEHKLYGGVVPEIASRRHCECISALTKEALVKSGLSFSDIDAVAVTYSPGLIGALLVGVNFAKGLALTLGVPLIPVHHIRGHIAANYINYKELEPPFLCLIVSGGHSHIVDVKSYTDITVLGRTRDDAAGEAFDKAARAMGIPYPGGVLMDSIAESGDDSAYVLPRPRVQGSPLDFSFSGLKTAVINIIHNAKQKDEEINKENLCASYRKALVDCLTDNFITAAKGTEYKNLVLAGGVCANKLLRREMIRLAGENKYNLYMPELNLCGDNAAMIAAQAYYEYKAGNIADMSLNAVAQRDISLG